MRAHLTGIVAITMLVAGPVAAQAPSGGANPVSSAIRGGWDNAKQNLARSAKVMPEDKFGFKPVDTVRSFGAILAHVAGANYIFCAAVRGEKSPHTEDAFEKTAKTKAEIVKALEESYKYCDAAYAAVNDAGLGQSITAPFTGGQSTKAEALMSNTGHLQEHYGNLVTYLRINGLVPPSSQQSQ